MNKEILKKTFRNTALAALYIFGVSQIMQNGEKIFGNVDNSILGPFAFLLLFSLSAAVVGGLVFGHALMFFLDGKKKESVQSAMYSIAWLAFYTLIAITTLIVFK